MAYLLANHAYLENQLEDNAPARNDPDNKKPVHWDHKNLVNGEQVGYNNVYTYYIIQEYIQ